MHDALFLTGKVYNRDKIVRIFHRSPKGVDAEAVSAAAAGVAVKGHGAHRACDGRHTDSRSLVNEAITTMDLPRISFLRREISKRPTGLDRVEFVMTMAT